MEIKKNNIHIKWLVSEYVLLRKSMHSDGAIYLLQYDNNTVSV